MRLEVDQCKWRMLRTAARMPQWIPIWMTLAIPALKYNVMYVTLNITSMYACCMLHIILQERVRKPTKKRSRKVRKTMKKNKAMPRKSIPKKSIWQRLFGRKNRVAPSTPANFPSSDIVSHSSSATYDSRALERENLEDENTGYQVS